MKTLKERRHISSDFNKAEVVFLEEDVKKCFKKIIKEIDKKIFCIEKSLHIGLMLEEQAGKGAFSDIEKYERDLLSELKDVTKIINKHLGFEK